jgi:hypothetical protein
MKGNKNLLYKENLNWPFNFMTIGAAGIFMAAFLLIYACYDGVPFEFVDFKVIIIPFLLTLPVINFSMLQVKLTNQMLTAQYGVIVENVKIEDIISARVYKYTFMEFLGWGIRFNFTNKIHAYNIIGDRFTGILITYKRKGYTDKLFISSRNPQQIIDLLKELNSNIKDE